MFVYDKEFISPLLQMSLCVDLCVTYPSPDEDFVIEHIRLMLIGGGFLYLSSLAQSTFQESDLKTQFCFKLRWGRIRYLYRSCYICCSETFKCKPIFGEDVFLTLGFSVSQISAVWLPDGGEKMASYWPNFGILYEKEKKTILAI